MPRSAGLEYLQYVSAGLPSLGPFARNLGQLLSSRYFAGAPQVPGPFSPQICPVGQFPQSLVAATVAGQAARDHCDRRSRACSRRRAALAGPASAADWPDGTAAAVDRVAAAVARGAALDARGGARPRRAYGGVRLHARAQIEEHKLEDGLLRGQRPRRARRGNIVPPLFRCRLGVPVAEGHAAALLRRTRRRGRVEREVYRASSAPPTSSGATAGVGRATPSVLGNVGLIRRSRGPLGKPDVDEPLLEGRTRRDSPGAIDDAGSRRPSRPGRRPSRPRP